MDRAQSLPGTQVDRRFDPRDPVSNFDTGTDASQCTYASLRTLTHWCCMGRNGFEGVTNAVSEFMKRLLFLRSLTQSESPFLRAEHTRPPNVESTSLPKVAGPTSTRGLQLVSHL